MLCPAFVSLFSNCALENASGRLAAPHEGERYNLQGWCDTVGDGPHSLPVSKDHGNKAFYEPWWSCTATISLHLSKEYCCTWFPSKIRAQDSSRSGRGRCLPKTRSIFLDLIGNGWKGRVPKEKIEGYFLVLDAVVQSGMRILGNAGIRAGYVDFKESNIPSNCLHLLKLQLDFLPPPINVFT